MTKELHVGDLIAQPGHATFGTATQVMLGDKSYVSLPVVLINGAGDGPTVAINGAVHPVELVGIAVTQVIGRKVDPRALKGRIIAFPITNPVGFRFGQFSGLQDSIDMFTAFPGNAVGNPVSRLAHFIWNVVAENSNLVIDLHGNAAPALQFTTVGYSDDSSAEKKALELAEAFGLTITRPSKNYFDSITDYTQLCLSKAIPSLMVELESGTDFLFNEQYCPVRIGIRGVMNCLKKLGMIDGAIESQSEATILPGVFETYGPLSAKCGGIVNRLAKVGVELKKGDPVANVIDSYGNVIESLLMPVDGYVWDWNIGAPPYYTLIVRAGDEVAYVYIKKNRRA